MKSRFCTLPHLAVLLLFTGSVAATPVTYRVIDWGDQRFPETPLVGSIVVDDADGNQVIAASEVLDWSFSAAVLAFGQFGAAPLPFSMIRGQGSQLTCSTSGCFKLVGEDLGFDLTNFIDRRPTRFTDSAGNQFDISGDTGLGGDVIAGDKIAVMRWFNTVGSGTRNMSTLSNNPDFLRIASVGAVPEPSSPALLALALAAAAGATGARGRRLKRPDAG